MAKNNVVDVVNASHYVWGNFCDSWVFLDTDTLSIKQEQMPAGSKEMLHLHLLSQQFFYILQGTATFTLDEEKVMVSAGQGLHVPAGTKHFIANENETELAFLVISQPATNNDREYLL